MQEIFPKRPEVGFYPINGRNYPGNSSIVDYGLGVNEAIVKFSLEEAARGIVREFKNQQKILSQKEAIEIAHKTRGQLLKRAAENGTALHTHAYDLINKKAEYNAENDDPYYQGLYLWLKQHEVRPVLMEKLLWDEVEGYAGRLDFFGYVDGRLRLMDFKSNRTIQPKMGLQLTGYKHLLEAWGYIEPGSPLEMVILHLTPGIAYEVPFFETWETYKTLKKMFWWKFYRYKPDVYYRSPEEAAKAELAQKKEASSALNAPPTSAEQQFAPDSNIQGQELRSEVPDFSPSRVLIDDMPSQQPSHTCPGQADKSPRETTAGLPQPARKRGRPRKILLPEEMELDPKSLTFDYFAGSSPAFPEVQSL